MSKKAKRYLMLLAALGILAVALGGGSGTFASFTAQVANKNNVFATGTLFLHNTKQGSGTTCRSEDSVDSTNVTLNCEVLLNSLKNKAGDTDVAYVKLANAGSIDASTFSVTESCADTGAPAIATAAAYATAASSLTLTGLNQPLLTGTQLDLTDDTGTTTYDTVTVTADDTNNNATVAISGATTGSGGNTAYVRLHTNFGSLGNLCNSTTGVREYVQEDNTNWGSALSGCAIPSSASSCAFSTNDVTMGDAQTNGAYSLGTLTAGQTRYFEIHLKMPTSLGNTAQNSQAKFDLTWDIAQ